MQNVLRNKNVRLKQLYIKFLTNEKNKAPTKFWLSYTLTFTWKYSRRDILFVCSGLITHF